MPARLRKRNIVSVRSRRPPMVDGGFLRSGSGRSQPFDAREPSGRGLVAFVVAPFGDHFELRVLDASDLPAVLEEGGDVLFGEPARPWERSVFAETHQPVPAGRTKQGVDAADHLL